MEHKPLLEPSLNFIWEAFWLLSGDRQLGGLGVIGSIPFMAIDRYAARFGIDDRDSFARFLSIVRRMDMAYIGHLNKKAELNNKKD